MTELISKKIKELSNNIRGDVYTSEQWRLMYATDASAYREVPLAVVRPKDENDIKTIISFANKNKISIIPRAAGTSLAGQVVGNGIVVDISKYMTNILEINQKEQWVRVQAGVVLDELNNKLKQYGLFFGPETSTSNRCMIAGMVGNNSCGAHSLIYGSTREHTLEVKTILSDGSEVVFKDLSNEEFDVKCKQETLEGKIYKQIRNTLSNKDIQNEINNNFPDAEIKRRNSGYAVDLLLDNKIFTDTNKKFNFCKLIAGSEGTLAFITEIKLNLVPLPPNEKVLICVHLDSVEQSLKANLIALKYKPVSVELMDKKILDLTKENLTQKRNRFFLKGDPGAILIIEFAEETKAQLTEKAQAMEKEMKANNYGFYFPNIFGKDISKVWALRKAGLGVLSNMPGDAKPVPVIEDTAVKPEKLPEYIAEFNQILKKYSLSCVYYAHIDTGELHLRPILNLKNKKDVELFYTIALEIAKLVKKYKGSLSGEHGDGHLRGEFIPLMYGDKIYSLFKEIKKTWDTNGIFNMHKIVDTPKMNTFLRYEAGRPTREIKTHFDFSKVGGIIRAVEKCNGSGDCRKSADLGGTMCPSFMATKDEDKVTRARVNILREFLTNSSKENPFDHKEIYEIMDLCLSCKACKSECPSGVDITKLKAEFLQHYYDAHGISFRTKVIAGLPSIHRLASIVPGVFNFFVKNKLFSGIMKYGLQFAKKRSIPAIQHETLNKWMKKHVQELSKGEKKKKVYLFNDEFTNYLDSNIGVFAVMLLNKLGYEVVIPNHSISARTYLSKGMLRKAKKIAKKNVLLLKDIICEETPLIGIEPSAILSFRDEFPELVDKNLQKDAEKLGENALLIDEFISAEMRAGNISINSFTDTPQKILYHGHCQQKAVASTDSTIEMLSFPKNYSIEEIPSGCCGMAGAYGYEKEHYDLSMKIGEMVLFPAIRGAGEDVIIAAAGTSCRHQIKDGTNRRAYHPVEILYHALKD